jgi:hypothetical protein
LSLFHNPLNRRCMVWGSGSQVVRSAIFIILSYYSRSILQFHLITLPRTASSRVTKLLHDLEFLLIFLDMFPCCAILVHQMLTFLWNVPLAIKQFTPLEFFISLILVFFFFSTIMVTFKCAVFRYSFSSSLF